MTASRFEKNLDLLLTEPDNSASMTPKWGTVLANGRVLLDHEGEPLPASTPSLVHLYPGLRVAVDSFGQTKRIIGGLTTGGLIPTSVDLNTLTHTGTWYVTSNAETSLARNFPMAVSGKLSVEAISDGYAQQTYRTWTTTNALSREFVRDLYAGTWREWTERVLWTPWIDLTLSGTWAPLSGGTFGTPAFRVGGGVVELSGAANGGTTGTSPALDVATIPTYARPDGDRLLTRRLGTGSGSGDVGDLRATSTGRLYVFLASYSGSWVNLTGLSYRLERSGAR